MHIFENNVKGFKIWAQVARVYGTLRIGKMNTENHRAHVHQKPYVRGLRRGAPFP